MISQRVKQASSLFGTVDAMLLVLALFLALGARTLAPLPLLADGIAIDLGTHIWRLNVHGLVDGVTDLLGSAVARVGLNGRVYAVHVPLDVPRRRPWTG